MSMQMTMEEWAKVWHGHHDKDSSYPDCEIYEILNKPHTLKELKDAIIKIDGNTDYDYYAKLNGWDD